MYHMVTESDKNHKPLLCENLVSVFMCTLKATGSTLEAKEAIPPNGLVGINMYTPKKLKTSCAMYLL